MHCYRIGPASEPATAGSPRAAWFDYLGLQSSGHGPQEPIAITYLEKNHPLARDLPEWTTTKEELYNNIKIFDSAQPIAQGKQRVKKKAPKGAPPATAPQEEEEKEAVVAWTNLYQGKTRVFSTSLGHNNETVADDRYLDLVTRGILWATGRIGSEPRK
jgi:hypothetical protein